MAEPSIKGYPKSKTGLLSTLSASFGFISEGEGISGKA